VDTYGEFVDANEELFKSLPPPFAALNYYMGSDLYLVRDSAAGWSASSCFHATAAPYM
jgi:hypothetical protein